MNLLINLFDLLGIEKVLSNSICEGIMQESKALYLDSYDLQLLHVFSSSLCVTVQNAMA